MKFTFNTFRLIEVKFKRDSNHFLSFETPNYYLKREDNDFDSSSLDEDVWQQCEHLLRIYKSYSHKGFGTIKLFPDGGSHVSYQTTKKED